MAVELINMHVNYVRLYFINADFALPLSRCCSLLPITIDRPSSQVEKVGGKKSYTLIVSFFI